VDVWCEICGHQWDSRDPGVRYIYGDGRWECYDEAQCFGRRAIRAALEHAFSQMPPAVPVR
jgi:hypothetical protein